MSDKYFVELWKEWPTPRCLEKTYGPYDSVRKAEKMEDALDNRINHEFYSCYVESSGE